MTKKRPRGRPASGSAMSVAERMRRLRERRKAAGLKPVIAWVAAEHPVQATYSSHRLLEARSLAMHAVIARKIERDPRLLEIARRNVERWSAQRNDQRPAWLDEWRELLNQPWENIAAHYRAQRERRAPAAIFTLRRNPHRSGTTADL